MATNNSNSIGKTKRSTDEIIADSIEKQDNWLAHRRHFTRRFLKSMNAQDEPVVAPHKTQPESNGSVLREYWFPILCAVIVLFVAIWALFVRTSASQRVVMFDTVKQTEQVAKPVKATTVSVPTFDCTHQTRRYDYCRGQMETKRKCFCAGEQQNRCN